MLMVRAGSSSGVSRPAAGVLWMLPALVVVVCTAIACATVSGTARAPIAWCGLAATVVAALMGVAGARRSRSLAELRVLYAEQDVALKRRLAQQEAETVRLAEVLLPEAVARLQKGEFAEDVLTSMATTEAGRNPDFQAAHRKVLGSVLEAVSAEEDLRDAAQRAFVNIARRVQAIIHQQAQDLREMEDRHGHTPEVFGDLLRLDHGTALVGRLADSIAVLGGARPGRQWSRAVPLFSVLRGAMSRILDYQRVELHSVSEIAVIGPTVEPLIHALAELLDNATRYSPPQTRVHLTAVEVQAGIAVEIEDGGVSLSEEARLRAERMLEQAQAGIDLNDLGETPRLGLAVVGRLSQAYGFQVSLRPSAYGGVRAVLIVPQHHLTTATATGRAHGIGAVGGTRPEKAPPRTTLPRQATGPRQSPPVPAAATASPSMDDAPEVTERTANGLPQRRRRSAAAPPRPTVRPDARPSVGAPTPSPAAAGDAPAPTEDNVQPGIWLAAFTSGVSGEPSASSSAREKSDESLDKGE
jgi:signal transduction histidine kinase